MRRLCIVTNTFSHRFGDLPMSLLTWICSSGQRRGGAVDDGRNYGRSADPCLRCTSGSSLKFVDFD